MNENGRTSLTALSGAPAGGREVEIEEERELVDLCRRGERDALERLFERFYPEVRRMLGRLSGPGVEVEDLVQTAMLEILRGLKSFRGEARLSSWVYRIVLNVANMHLRTKMRRPPARSLEDFDPPSPEKDVLTRLEDEERRAVLRELLGSLPPKKREVFLLAEMERLPADKIAEILGCSTSAVWSRLHQARRLFWEKARRHGYFSYESR